MEFEVTHTTDYTYQPAAAEAYLEARLTPPDLPTQTVRNRRLVIEPAVKVSGYTDYFGNAVDFFSLPYRHRSLAITSRMDVQTHTPARPAAALEVSINEARQILHSSASEVFDYLQPTDTVEHTRDAANWAKRYLRGNRPLGEALEALNLAVNEQFAYVSGSTTNQTPLATVWQQRKGVCQDFTHVMLSVLRLAGLPARYVCGYIEAVAPPSAESGNTLGPRRADAGRRGGDPCLGRSPRAGQGVGGARPDEQAMVRRAAHHGVAREGFPRRDAPARHVQGHGQADDEGEGVREAAGDAGAGPSDGGAEERFEVAGSEAAARHQGKASTSELRLFTFFPGRDVASMAISPVRQTVARPLLGAALPYSEVTTSL